MIDDEIVPRGTGVFLRTLSRRTCDSPVGAAR